MRDKLTRLLRQTGEGVDATMRDMSNRISGGINEVYQSVQPDEASDAQLAERVRATLGRVVSHPHAIDVTAENGRVCLSGPILAHEVQPLLRAASSVRGVAGIDNQLDIHEQAGNIPALQGTSESNRDNRSTTWRS
jgi:osmotically-inducible protein OsmY